MLDPTLVVLLSSASALAGHNICACFLPKSMTAVPAAIIPVAVGVALSLLVTAPFLNL